MGHDYNYKPQTSEQVPLATWTRSDANPSIAIGSSGRSVLAFQSATGTDLNVLAVTLSDFGVVGPKITIAASADDEADPAVAMPRTGGKFFVAYRVGAAGLDSSIHVAKATTAGAILSDDALGLAWTDPAISVVGSRYYLVTYTSEVTRQQDWGRGIFGRFTTM